MARTEALRAAVEQHIDRWNTALPDTGLYAPMAYLMRLPAKRIRPVALLLAHELFGGDHQQVLDEALAIEVFHNFTLMHDDIMDAAPLRRGMPTVHLHWNVNTAILSGDAMLVKAHQLMGRDPRAAARFEQRAIEVCEGQQLDMEFEQRGDVTLADYNEMIRLKTAVLLAGAMEIGALLAGASDADVERIGQFGEHLGLAFQLRDDLLDAFGDPDKVGKQVGGDLRAGKKTWLLLRGLAVDDGTIRDALLVTPDQRDVPRMIAALERSGARADAEAEVARLDQQALAALDSIAVPEERKQHLRALAAQLMVRVH
ncbi:MAG: polyprenyl synthetase family protein [Flavobacteriales bacterium]|jgi:geranylgeranyl diphosphate synthase type II|nr:polyprenyl synthetase family protein [Flavobacteriales bacterium]